MDKNSKKQVAKISVFITSIFVIFLSITYAFINMTVTGTKRQVITAGNLEIELEEENAITLANAMPMYDEVGMLQDSFNFKLKNTGTASVQYMVKLVDVTDSSKKKLDTSIVKYGLTKDGEDTIQYLSDLNDNQLDAGIIREQQTIQYNLRLWIGSKVEDNSSIQDKSLSYRVDVVASQETGTILKNTIKYNDYSEIVVEDEYTSLIEMKDSFKNCYMGIKKIIFEDSINIPEDSQSWDISAAEDKSVMAYLENDGTVVYYGKEIQGYIVHIQANGKIYANENSDFMFAYLHHLTAIEGMENLDTSKVTSMKGMFVNCNALTNVDLSHFDTSNVTDMSFMFSANADAPSSTLKIATLSLENFNTSKVTNMSNMFNGCTNLLSLDLSSFDTSNVTNMSYMFCGCSSLINLDINHFNTSNLVDMSYMFLGCSCFSTSDISHFDTSNVTNMSGLFYGYSSSQPLDLSHLDTSNVTDMSEMFADYSSSQPLDLSYLDTSNVVNMSYMFSGYSSSQPLDLSRFDTSNAVNMSNMFSDYSSSQPLDLSHFDTSNVADMSAMFYNSEDLLSLDLSGFDTSKVTDMSSMFSGCSFLESIDISNFNILNVTGKYRIFYNISSSCLVTVKDETMRAWVLEQNRNLTNIVVKSA